MSISYLVSEAVFQISEKEKIKSGMQTGFVAALDFSFSFTKVGNFSGSVHTHKGTEFIH